MSNHSVLIVEDTPVNLKVVRFVLHRAGFDVRTATSAEEALEVLEHFRPRVILTDIQLPGMDGYISESHSAVYRPESRNTQRRRAREYSGSSRTEVFTPKYTTELCRRRDSAERTIH